MEHVLTEHGFRLLYIRDRGALGDLDRDAVLEDLLDGLPPGETMPPVRLDLREYDHLVIASDLATGRNLGILGGLDHVTSQESLLVLETAYVVAEMRGQHLMRRMIAFTLLRMAGLEALPDAVVSLSHSAAFCHVLSETAAAMGPARFAPEPAQDVIRLAPAALLQRAAVSLGHKIDHAASRIALQDIGPFRRETPLQRVVDADMPPSPPSARIFAAPLLVAIDLRHADEAELLRDARRLYRARPPRVRPVALPSLERNPFWPAARPERSCPAWP